MTLTSNTPITQANVALLKAGDWLRHKPTGWLMPFVRSGPFSVTCIKPSSGKEYDALYGNLTYIGPDLGDGWIGWAGGENPVPGIMVDGEFGNATVTNCLSSYLEQTGIWKTPGKFRPAIAKPVERSDPELLAWTWLDRQQDEAPAGIAYSADQMVDAFIAGQASQHSAFLDAPEKIAADGQPCRPVLAKPAEVLDPRLVSDNARFSSNNIHAPTPLAKPAEGSKTSPTRLHGVGEVRTTPDDPGTQRQRKDHSTNISNPTPPSVDHIGDATEKVDWERVGPKLVEALGELVAAMRRYEVDVDADAPYSHVEMMQRADAALAATQPQSNGD